MKTKFNLSNKIEHEDNDKDIIRVGEFNYILTEDIKEFIRLLKDGLRFCPSIREQWNLIDKLAGEKLK